MTFHCCLAPGSAIWLHEALWTGGSRSAPQLPVEFSGFLLKAAFYPVGCQSIVLAKTQVRGSLMLKSIPCPKCLFCLHVQSYISLKWLPHSSLPLLQALSFTACLNRHSKKTYSSHQSSLTSASSFPPHLLSCTLFSFPCPLNKSPNRAFWWGNKEPKTF